MFEKITDFSLLGIYLLLFFKKSGNLHMILIKVKEKITLFYIWVEKKCYVFSKSQGEIFFRTAENPAVVLNLNPSNVTTTLFNNNVMGFLLKRQVFINQSKSLRSYSVNYANFKNVCQEFQLKSRACHLRYAIPCVHLQKCLACPLHTSLHL